MQLDKLTMNLKAYIGIFTDSKLDGEIGESIKSLNAYFDALYKLDKEHKEVGKGASNLSAGIGTITDSLALIGIASVLNLKKVKGMFDAVLVSVKGLTKGLNIYLLLFLAGLAVVQNLHKLSIGSHMSSDEIDAIYKENEAYHERQKEIAKAKEAIDKEHKALANLKTQMDTMALSDFNFKLKSINDTFKEGMKDVYGMGEALKSLTELQVKLNMPSMDKKFRENAEKIKSFEKFDLKGTTEEGIKELADKKIRDKFDIKDVEGGKGVVDRKTFLYGAAAYIRENYLFMSPTTEEDYYKKIQSYIPKEKGNFKQESLKEIDRLTKEKKKDDEYFIKKMKEYVELEGKRSPQNAENLKFAEYAKAEGNKDKQNKIAEQNKWSSNDINRLTKEREKFVKQDTEIKAKQGEIKNELNKNISLFTKWGRTQADFNTMISTMDKHVADMAKNTTAEYEQRVKVLDDMTKALSEISDKISEIQLKQAESFMKLNNYKNLTDFKKGLDKVGLSSYKGLIKEFSGVIDSYASQGAKMDFMNGKFMDMAGAIQSFSNAQEKLKDNIKIVGAGEAVDSLGNKTGQSIAQLYGKLSMMKGGIGGAQAAKEMNKYNSDTLAVLNKINEAYGEIGEIDKLKEMEKVNAGIQQKSLLQVEKYNSSIDSQLLSLNKINASKLESLKIDKDMAKIQYNLAKSKQSEVVTEKVTDVMNDFISLRDKTKNGLFKEGDILNLEKLPKTIEVQKGKNVKSLTPFQKKLKAENFTELDFSNLNSLTKFVEIAKKLEIDNVPVTVDEARLTTKASEIRTEMLKGKEAEVKYAEDLMIYEKGTHEAFQSYFSDYLEYLSKSEQEIKVMEYKKNMYETMADLQMEISKDESGKEIKKETEDSLKLRLQAKNIENEMRLKEIENVEKILSLDAERERYSIKRQMYFGSDLKALQMEYDISKQLLKNENESLLKQKSKIESSYTNPDFMKESLDLLKERKIANENEQSVLSKSEKPEDKTRLEGLRKQALDYIAEEKLLSDLLNMGERERSKYLKNNVKYKEILTKLAKNEYETNELDINNWKERLRIEYELREIAYDMKTIQSDTEREKSRNLYKEVFGSQGFDEAESKANIEKAKQAEITAFNKVEDIKNKALKAKFKETGIELTDEDAKTLLKDEAINKDIVSSLDDNIEAQKAIKEAQEAGLNTLKATNEEELKRIQYLKQQVESVLDIVDALSKGETIKFDPSKAIKGASGALTKIYANSQETDESKKQKLTGKDYADMAVAGIGVATNVINQVYDSQMNVVKAELSNLELRKQLAKTDEERQKIDEEILNKQKQQIELEYKKSTQTMGITGVAGSAIGGAMSGAMMGGQIGGAYGAAIGGGLGLISGIFGGNSAKKDAEQQKKQLEAQLRANQYLESLQKLQELNNNLVENVISGVEKGIRQALEESFKIQKQTAKEKGTFDVNKEWYKGFSLRFGGSDFDKAWELINGESFQEYWDREKEGLQLVFPNIKNSEEYRNFLMDMDYLMQGDFFKIEMQTNISEIQESISKLDFDSSAEDIEKVQGRVQDMIDVIKLSGGANNTQLDERLNDWLTYLNTLENLLKKQDVLYSEYFGFVIDKAKTKEGLITDISIGEWEKRTSFLDSFVESALGGTNKISKAVADLTIEGFANAFIRNNTEISDSLKKLETGILDFSTFMATGTSKDFKALRKRLSGVVSGEELNNVYKIVEVISLVQITKELTSEQEKSNLAVQEFASLWVKAGGSIEDIIDMMPEFTKTLQSAMKNSLSETDYTDRFNSIGSALKSTIETKLNEVSFAKLQKQFISTNSSLSSLMSGDLTMNNMAQLSQGIAKYTAQAEQSAYKTKAMLDMLQLDQTVDYGVSNTQVEYKTGSTNTNVYNISNNVTTTIGNLLGDARAMQNFTDSIVGYMVESMQKQGVLKK